MIIYPGVASLYRSKGEGVTAAMPIGLVGFLGNKATPFLERGNFILLANVPSI